MEAIMLVITRKVGESIIIDTGTDKIEIVLTEVRGKASRLGIIADSKYSVVRKEIESKETKQQDVR